VDIQDEKNIDQPPPPPPQLPKEEPKQVVEKPAPVPKEEPKKVVEEPPPVVPPQEPVRVVQPPQVEVELGFLDDQGNIKKFKFSQKPLGMNFNTEMPIKIGSFEVPSHAQSRGVQIGMVLAQVDGESLTGKTYSDAWQKLKAAVSTLPSK